MLSKHSPHIAAAWLALTSQSIIPDCDAAVMSTPSTARQLIQHIRDDQTLLVPYDCDKNHEPCLASGHKAHWCVLVTNSGVELFDDS
jgi:hypothetical protein